MIVKEGYRFYKASAAVPQGQVDWVHLLAPSAVGMVFSFAAGLLALRWLSSWLGEGRWHYFGFYCLAVSACLFLFGGNLP